MLISLSGKYVSSWHRQNVYPPIFLSDSVPLFPVHADHNVSVLYRKHALKKTGICLDSTFCKIYTMSFFLKCYSRFIESNMIISSNSKKLQINPTYHGNYLVIFFTGMLTVCIHSVWNICMGFFNIYMVQ